jgi:hypothetical protein
MISTANAAHPWGSWVSHNGTVYYSTQSGLVGVPTPAIFTANGGQWKFVVPANSYDLTTITPSSTLANNDSRVYSPTNPNPIKACPAWGCSGPEPVPTPINSPIVIPNITLLSSTSGTVGTQITITGNGFGATGNNVVAWINPSGTNAIAAYYTWASNLSSTDGTTLTFTIPSVAPSSICTVGNNCPLVSNSNPVALTPGTYWLAVDSANQTGSEQGFILNSSSTTTTTPTISQFTATPSSYGNYLNVYNVSWTVIGANAGQVLLDADCKTGLTISTVDDGGNLQPFQCGDTVVNSVAYAQGSEFFQFTNTSSQSINESIGLTDTGISMVKVLSVTIPSTAGGLPSPSSTVLNATINPAFAGGTVTQGVTNQKIGSYILTNNSNQNTTLGNIFFGIDSALYGGQPVFENIVAKVNNVQFGQILSSLSSVGAYAFAGNTPVTIPAGTSVTVDLYADVPINTNDPSYINTVSLIENCSPTSLYSGSAGCNSVSGQSLTISGLATLNLQASLSSTSPASGSVSGSSSQLIADYNVIASGSSATIQEMDFSVVGSSSTPITAVTVGNSVVAVNSSNAVAVYGLNISVPVNGSGTNIPVSVNYAPVGVNGIPTGQKFTLNLTKVKCVDSNGIAYVFPLNIPSNQMTLISQ